MSGDTLVKGIPPTKVLTPGRPKGTGRNQLLLKRLEPGNVNHCIWGVTKGRMEAIKWTAYNYGMTLKIRYIGDGEYSIWRMT